MPSHRHLYLTVFLLSLVSPWGSPSATEAADPLVAGCYGCHGPKGVSRGPATPSIRGLSRVYFLNAMLAYKYDEDEAAAESAAPRAGLADMDLYFLPRSGTIMNRIAKGYTEEQIARLADFFADQPFTASNQPIDGFLVRQGERLHQKHCEKCHENQGRDYQDGAGRLAGQWKPYLHNALVDFKNKTRKMPKKMARRLNDLDAEDLRALVEFYASRR